MVRIAIIAVLICFGFSMCFAQDSARKKAGAKPHHIYKYRGEAYRKFKLDSAAKAAAPQVPVKKDSVTAAAVPPAPPANNSLNGQYQYLLSKVYNYQRPLISALWKNASDTLNVNRLKLKDAQSKLNVQTKTIDSLNTEITAKDKAISRTDDVDIFGIVLSKTTYNIIAWGLVALFAAIAFIVIVRSGSFKREARYRTELYAELEEEFKTYKAKANEKEKKLARELQTERNKLDELLGR
jgi:hypothetical protein